LSFPFLFPPFFGVGFLLYFLPSIIALARSKRNTLFIFTSKLLPGLDACWMGRCSDVGGESGRFSGSGSLDGAESTECRIQ
jgi:hypothetical protein